MNKISRCKEELCGSFSEYLKTGDGRGAEMNGECRMSYRHTHDMYACIFCFGRCCDVSKILLDREGVALMGCRKVFELHGCR